MKPQTTTQTTATQPRRTWREIYAHIYSSAWAENARRALCDLHVYPTKPRDGNPDHEHGTAFERAELHTLIDEIDAADLHALRELARVFAVHRPSAGLFEWIAEQQREWWNTVGSKIGRRKSA